MSDQGLRRLHRAWLESGSLHDAEKLDEACRRSGVTSEPRQAVYAQLLELLDYQARTISILVPHATGEEGDDVVELVLLNQVPLERWKDYTANLREAFLRYTLSCERFVDITLTREIFDALRPGDTIGIRIISLWGWPMEHRTVCV